jgi:CRISPR-associated protein Cmr6
MQTLLGYQEGEIIKGGKFEFLDAFPLEPTLLTLDIVNPQQNFQVFHDGQSKPLSAYTLGDGEEEIAIKVAIRGIAGQTTPTEVDKVWSWLTQALTSKGIGSRTASGYGQLSPVQASPEKALNLPPGYEQKVFDFTLLSQGNAGPKTDHPELRPTHWRGWLRSWLLRFFLGVMTPENARFTVGELLGTLEESTDGKQRLGTVSLRLQLDNNNGTLGNPSREQKLLQFYQWQGQVEITAPKALLNEIILPIIRVAATVGGVGKGWRRPLHQFMMERRNQPSVPSARGCHLILKHEYKNKKAPFVMPLRPEEWLGLYGRWETSVRNNWPGRFASQQDVNAEVFSPRTSAVYVVPGPNDDPLDMAQNKWSHGLKPTQTRGQGMNLIYKDEYKRQPDVGGDAAAGAGYCSWVTIKRMNTKGGQKEIVCVFGGAPHELRQFFLQDLQEIDGAVHLFGDF